MNLGVLVLGCEHCRSPGPALPTYQLHKLMNEVVSETGKPARGLSAELCAIKHRPTALSAWVSDSVMTLAGQHGVPILPKLCI